MYFNPPITQNKIILNSNRLIIIDEFYQEPTYLGLIEGFPMHFSNKEILKSLNNTVKQKIWVSSSPFIIRPIEKPIKLNPGVKERYIIKPKEFQPMALPNITCIANFSSEPIDEQNYSLSYLSIVWFQHDYAMPISTNIIKKIKEINWEERAVDANY